MPTLDNVVADAIDGPTIEHFEPTHDPDVEPDYVNLTHGIEAVELAADAGTDYINLPDIGGHLAVLPAAGFALRRTLCRPAGSPTLAPFYPQSKELKSRMRTC